MRKVELLDIDLSLFDGGAAGGGDGGGAAATGAGDGTGNQGGTQAGPVSTRRGKSGENQRILYGKQPSAADGAAGGETAKGNPPVAGEGKQDGEPAIQATSDTLEAKRKAYRELVDGEYKDQYTEDTQRIVNRRFKETAQLREQLQKNQPVIDVLMQRYKIADGDITKLTAAIENDNAYWSQAAEEAGMSVDQYKQFQKLQRDNAALLQAQRQTQSQQQAEAQLQAWYSQAEQVKGLYPNFDLNAEVKNPQFLSMLKAGVPVQHAYEVVHMEEIKAGVAAMQARATEKQVTDGIRARGTRPTENGTAAQSGFTVKDDVSKLSKADRAEIVRQVSRGAHIEF